MLSPSDEASLRDLAYHWEDAYAFAILDGVWTAIPAGDPAGMLTADSAHELRELVRRDYAGRKLTRHSDASLHERSST